MRIGFILESLFSVEYSYFLVSNYALFWGYLSLFESDSGLVQ